jgi:hypothetical protein
MLSVFWGPRIGRYFDQIVLSGILPLRFMIGKATSQNLFLGLILFLLLPYLVLSLTLGGVDLGFFLAGLFLVWLYCMALALVTLWASLYLNEGLSAILVISVASILSVLGCIPMRFQPFVLTPFPALIHPLYSSIPFFDGRITPDFLPVFFSCAACLTVVIVASLFAIYLGPLYGIIRENSTFGEVVCAGDNRRKRWFRLRLHIQRPSEIAFFYENRSRAFRRNEGLIRWGIQFCVLLLVSGGLYLSLVDFMSTFLATWNARSTQWRVYEFHTMYLIIHGCSLSLAIFAFSHARNSTYMPLPFFRGRMVEVSRLDTTAFLLFALVSSAMAIATPFYFEQYFASPNGYTIFPDLMNARRGRPVDYGRIAVEGVAVISLAGLVVYAFHRLVCLLTWTRSATLVLVGGSYFMAVCMLPVFVAVLFLEVPELRRMQPFADWAPSLAMASPFVVIMFLFNEMGSRFPRDVSTAPFYVVHGMLLLLMIFEIHRRGRKLREMYLAGPVQETS